MKSQLNKFALIGLLGLAVMDLKAQNSALAEDVHFNIEPLGMAINPTDPSQTSNILLHSDSIRLAISMILSDTANVNKIHIQLGSSAGENNLLDKVFTYGNPSPGEGCTYFSYKDMVVLGLGEYGQVTELFGQVILEDHSGNTSLPIHIHQ